MSDDSKPGPSTFTCALVGLGAAAGVCGVMALLAGKKDEKFEAVRYLDSFHLPPQLHRHYSENAEPVGAVYDTDARTLKVRVEDPVEGEGFEDVYEVSPYEYGRLNRVSRSESYPVRTSYDSRPEAGFAKWRSAKERDRKMAADANSAEQKEPWRIAAIEFIKKHGGAVEFNISDSVNGAWKTNASASERDAELNRLTEEAKRQGLPLASSSHTSGYYHLTFKRPDSQKLKLPWSDKGSYL